MNDDSYPLDQHCLNILLELQRDSRQTIQQIADAVGLSATPCWRRIKEMETAGVIRGYTVVIDREKVGLNIAAVTEVNIERHSTEQVDRFEAQVMASPHITRCVSATGTADYILSVLAHDVKSYEQIMRDTLFKLPGVTHVRSSIVLRDVKSDRELPLGDWAAVKHRR